MSNEDSTIKIPIVAEADTGGFVATQKAARETATQVQQAAQNMQVANTEQAAQESAALAKTREESARAADEEAAKMQALDALMKLEAMAKRELTAEVQRLAEARKQAAKAGDAQALQQLTAQYKEAKGVLTQMHQAANLNKAAMMGQASAGMQLAASMQRLGEQASRGSTDIAGMASQVMSLGMALKAGLGPIGWVMMALQGLQAAFDAWQNKKTGDLNRELEETRRHIEALQNAWQRAADAGDAQRKALLDGIRRERQEMQEAQALSIQKLGDQEAQAAKEAKMEDDRKLGAAKQRYEIEKARIEAEKARGAISEKTASAQMRVLEDEMRRVQQEITQAAEQRGKAATEAQTEALKQQLKDMEEAAQARFGSESMQKLLTIKMPAESEIKALELRLSEVDDAEEEAELRKANDELQKKIRLIKKLMEEMGVSTEGGYKAVAAFVRDMQEANKETQKMLTAKRREVGLSEAEVSNLQERMAVEEELRAGAEETLAAQRKAEDERREARDREKKLSDEWAEMQRKSLAEQAQWLAETASHYKKGSAEARRWAKELRNVSAKKIAEELGDLETTYKVTGSYAKQDSRTQAAIHAADEKALQARRAALERLKASPDVDAATLKAINKKIRDTDAELRGLHKSMKQAALEAQKSVENLKPLGQKAKAPNLQHSLVRAEKAYTELAKKAERQAAKGDVKGMERTIADMRRMALAQERMTGYTGKAAEQHKEVVAKLQSIVRGTSEQEKGLTAHQKQQNEILKTLGYEAKHKAKAAAAAKKIADAQEKEAQADEQTAQKAQQAARQIKPAQQAQQTQQTAAEVSTLRAQVQQMETAQQKLNSNMSSLSGALGKLATAAERTADITGQMATATTAALDRLEKKLTSLAKQLDRISRKIQ